MNKLEEVYGKAEADTALDHSSGGYNLDDHRARIHHLLLVSPIQIPGRRLELVFATEVVVPLATLRSEPLAAHTGILPGPSGLSAAVVVLSAAEPVVLGASVQCRRVRPRQLRIVGFDKFRWCRDGGWRAGGAGIGG